MRKAKFHGHRTMCAPDGTKDNKWNTTIGSTLATKSSQDSLVFLLMQFHHVVAGLDHLLHQVTKALCLARHIELLNQQVLEVRQFWPNHHLGLTTTPFHGREP